MSQRRQFLQGALASGTLGLCTASAYAAPSKTHNIQWDETFDVIIVGSGAAGMTSAVACKANGIKNGLSQIRVGKANLQVS